METSAAICVGSLFYLLWLLRRNRTSLGLPFAYLISLLLIHLPGAYAHIVSDMLPFTEFVRLGIWYTAVASASFVGGVLAVSLSMKRLPQPVTPFSHEKFAWFCLVGGWLFTYGLSPLHSIPSLGAAVDKGGTIWMLGVILGLRTAMQQSNLKQAAFWMIALMVYPVLMLLLGGFLSYGTAAIIIVLSSLTISVRKPIKVYAGIVVGAVLALNVFVNYFAHRTEIRREVWGGAPLSERIDATLDVIRDFEWFDTSNHDQLIALDARLNQNYFAGLAGARLDAGVVEYLNGRSAWEGLIALVPRALWPDKPVVAGSPKIVSEMTGLRLNQNTSFGVGNVMEMEINFGVPGLAVGFFLFGLVLRLLDRNAAAALDRRDYGRAILSFLPAVAMIQPNGSFVEVCGGAASALIAGLGWRWLWRHWSNRNMRRRRFPHRPVQPIDIGVPRQ